MNGKKNILLILATTLLAGTSTALLYEWKDGDLVATNPELEMPAEQFIDNATLAIGEQQQKNRYTIICSCIFEEEKKLKDGPGLTFIDKSSDTFRKEVITPLRPNQINIESLTRIGYCGENGTPSNIISVWYFGSFVE